MCAGPTPRALMAITCQLARCSHGARARRPGSGLLGPPDVEFGAEELDGTLEVAPLHYYEVGVGCRDVAFMLQLKSVCKSQESP